MQDTEALREAIVSMRREIDHLRMENLHAHLLLATQDAALGVHDSDAFGPVFAALMPAFDCSSILVLLEQGAEHSMLRCMASNCPELTGLTWQAGPLLQKVLAGRTISTVADAQANHWPAQPHGKLSPTQPALYLPLTVQGCRGMMMLTRRSDEPGFDRGHVELARKLSRRSSHLFAARQTKLSEADSRRLRELNDKLQSSHEALHFRATHDQLTGLPNRTHVQELVTAMIARQQSGQTLALAFINLDEFKLTNELHGNIAGDALLRAVASRVQSQIRQADIFGRIGADEFVVALDAAGQRPDVTVVMDRIRAQLRQPLSIQDTQILPSASIGVAIYPSHGTDYETLRRHADLAMQHAKATVKGSVVLFTKDLGRQAHERLTLEQHLREAVAAGEFCCALQRKVDIRTGAITGFEALARWVEAQGSVRMPGEFLPLACKLHLLDDIALQVVDDLARHLPQLDARFGNTVRYSLNISPDQAVDSGFMTRLVQHLPAGQAQRFIFEITEESLADTGVLEAHLLPMLREAGVRISIDDFGAGYSSLSTLAALTVDELKIDRSLIQCINERPRNQVILRAIESLGTALGLAIVAEGIETEQERNFLLQSTAITIGQGYLFHKPQLLRDLVCNEGQTQVVCRA